MGEIMDDVSSPIPPAQDSSFQSSCAAASSDSEGWTKVTPRKEGPKRGNPGMSPIPDEVPDSRSPYGTGARARAKTPRTSRDVTGKTIPKTSAYSRAPGTVDEEAWGPNDSKSSHGCPFSYTETRKIPGWETKTPDQRLDSVLRSHSQPQAPKSTQPRAPAAPQNVATVHIPREVIPPVQPQARYPPSNNPVPQTDPNPQRPGL